jgi:hypothetical protein
MEPASMGSLQTVSQFMSFRKNATLCSRGLLFMMDHMKILHVLTPLVYLFHVPK